MDSSQDQVTRELTLRFRETPRPTSPFHFVGTVHKPSHLPAQTNDFDSSGYYVTMSSPRNIYGIHLAESRDGSIELGIYASGDLGDEESSWVIEELRFRFGLDLDMREFVSMAISDPVLSNAVSRWGGMRPSCAFSLYELVCITTVLQNTQVNRSVTMLDTLLRNYGQLVRFADRELFAFWSPKRMNEVLEEDLRALKVGYRAKSFVRVAAHFDRHPDLESELRGLSKESAGKLLREVYGVGPATVWYLLFEGLKHLDALDHISPWEQKILSRLMFDQDLTPVTDILEFADTRWGEYKMLAVRYLFEDAFWRRKHESLPWLDALIRL